MENKKWRWWAWVIIGMLLLGVGWSIGYIKGNIDGIGLSVKIGFLILKDQNFTIEFEEQKITQLISAYRNQIADCSTDMKI